MDDDGRILLQRRTDFKVWGLPGGILEPGESITDCARRELKEEASAEAGALTLTGIYTDPAFEAVYPNGDAVQQFTICFRGRWQGGALIPDGSETSALKFFAPQEIPSDALFPFYVKMIHDALGNPASPVFTPPFARTESADPFGIIRPYAPHGTLIGSGATSVTRREDGKILMVRRTDNGHWVLPGGYTNLGENAAFTAVRETREESGYEVLPQRILGVYSPQEPWIYPNSDAVQPLVVVFACRLTGGSAAPDQRETDRVAWMTPAEIDALPSHPLLTPLNRLVLTWLD